MKAVKNLVIVLSLAVLIPTVCLALNIKDLPVPAGYRRLEYADSSYSAWIQKLPIKEDNIILGYDGESVNSSVYRVLAVIDLPLLFSQDLEQCAEWCFRFRAEFYKQTGRIDRLYLFDYNGLRRYYRNSGKNINGFLRWAMSNANSYSLKKGCLVIDSTELRPGDMLVQNQRGGVGHVSVIMDVSQKDESERLYPIGYGFMPAQQFHLERAGAERDLGRVHPHAADPVGCGRVHGHGRGLHPAEEETGHKGAPGADGREAGRGAPQTVHRDEFYLRGQGRHPQTDGG